jgi:hypothetical protein
MTNETILKVLSEITGKSCADLMADLNTPLITPFQAMTAMEGRGVSYWEQRCEAAEDLIHRYECNMAGCYGSPDNERELWLHWVDKESQLTAIPKMKFTTFLKRNYSEGHIAFVMDHYRDQPELINKYAFLYVESRLSGKTKQIK